MPAMLKRRLRWSPGAPGPLGRDLVTDEEFVRLAYNIVLDREPDQGGWDFYLAELRSGRQSRFDVLDTMRHGMEARDAVRTHDLELSLHLSRCDFVRSFPRSGRILDLGGTHQSDPNGALVSMGYPYPFEELVIVDLPLEERHELYGRSAPITEHRSPLGPVAYRYHSMADLSGYRDASFGLVYSGQTIEHVTETECDQVLAEVARVLTPGGWFCLDTPNGPLCRLHTDAFVNPDHKVEYGRAELAGKLVAAGLEVREEKGLNWAGTGYRTRFSIEAVTRNVGVFAEAEECFLLAYVARKPPG